MNKYILQKLFVRLYTDIVCLPTFDPVRTMNPSVKPKHIVGTSIGVSWDTMLQIRLARLACRIKTVMRKTGESE
jgi:hypothetical protein